MGFDRVQLLSGGSGRERSRAQKDIVVRVVEATEVAAVLLVADVLGEVLMQRAAERDVQQLHAAADTEHRHVAGDGGARERDLGAITLGYGLAGRCVARLPVLVGADVSPAGEYQRVDKL
jgi:hypothetical protein